ncbi:MAG: class I SAM-dependent methyltransferase [Candidatus Omnitrophota bacterium]
MNDSSFYLHKRRKHIRPIHHWWGWLVFRYAGRNMSSKNSARSRFFYNVIACLYDRLYADQIFAYRRVVRMVVDSSIRTGDRVLDLGCGTGLLMDMAAEKARSVYGLDISFSMIRGARKKMKKRAHTHLINGDCRQLPLGGKFDKILSSFMLVILDRPARREVIRSLYPLLEEDGELIFITSREEFSPQWLSQREWTQYCCDAGFRFVEFEECYGYYRVVRARKNPKAKEI